MTVEPLVQELERNYAEAQARLEDPELFSDLKDAAAAGRRLKELEGPYRLALEWRLTSADLEAARADSDLAELVPDLERSLVDLEEDLKAALSEHDPEDDKDVILEIRPGVGGSEAALWAGDLYRLLEAYAERCGFKTEPMSATPNEGGGLKEVSLSVKGAGAYAVFKWESGTHRVQRVPQTESQGRTHTSTATVAVMPEVEEVEIEVDPNDLKIDVYRSTGPGGQSVNTTDSAVRITHLPTGLVVAIQDEKSQHKNKDKALRVLRARLYELERSKREAETRATRQAQVGSGDRAEKIRTYNWADSRVTDHRVKVTVNLERVLTGELGAFTSALKAEERRLQLEASLA